MRPRARAAAKPAVVLSAISSRSNSAKAAKMPKASLPLAVVVSIWAPAPASGHISIARRYTYAIVFAPTGTVVHFNGVPQLGLDLDRADDMVGHLEAVDHIAAARGMDRLDS